MKDFKVILKFSAKGVKARCVKVSENSKKNCCQTGRKEVRSLY